MLSVVITAWNEEKNLPRVVGSVKGLADEVVVVDTESTDNTVKVARKLGCKVYSHTRPGIVEIVRNFSITKATGDWILLLDADEELPKSLLEHIKKTLENPTADYYRIPRKNVIFTHWVASDHWWPDFVYRLFRKGAVTWQETIHSIPQTEGLGADFPVDEKFAIVHHNYDTISQFVGRLNRYTDFQAENLKNSGYSFVWADILVKPSAEFLSQYFSRRGFTQGFSGLVMASLQAFSELVLYLKIWQAEGFTNQKISPSQITKVLKNQTKEYMWWYYQARINSSSFITRPFWKLVRWLRK